MSPNLSKPSTLEQRAQVELELFPALHKAYQNIKIDVVHHETFVCIEFLGLGVWLTGLHIETARALVRALEVTAARSA